MSSFFNAPSARRLWPLPLLLLPLLYLTTMAVSPVVGDPTEYTFVAHVLGVAHPPGYAFITLIAKLYQTMIPFGSIAWRTHLLGPSAATIAACCVYGSVRRHQGAQRLHSVAGALFAALTVGLGANFWQHAIHANPHIISAAFLLLYLFLLTVWHHARHNRWLYLFCLAAGVGVTHHPLTVFSLPACLLFILVVWPRILLAWRVLLIGTLCALVGLIAWLYFPLRAAALADTQFVTNMNSLDGFLDVVLARGLRTNLFHFGPADQIDRLRVFWSLLRVQYSLGVVALALLGIGRLARHLRQSPLLLLYGGALLLTTAFIINTVQDVMAYLIGPFAIIGLLSGVGVIALLDQLQQRRLLQLVLLLLLLGGPVWQLGRNLPHISLRSYSEGQRYIDEVAQQFDSRAQNATLLNDWEHMTVLWYDMLVNGRDYAAQDVRPIFVSAGRPWLDHVFEQLPQGPVYLSRFERSIVDAGFRLRPHGALWQVVEPGADGVPADLTPIDARFGDVELLGYSLPQRVAAGESAALIVALRAPTATDDIYLPQLRVGDALLAFTTDSHLLSSDWLPGEVIVEKFDFALDPALAGQVPIALSIVNLTGPQPQREPLDLGLLTVSASERNRNDADGLAIFRQRVALQSATARSGLQRRQALWQQPLRVQSGATIHITLDWHVLAVPAESYTVFVHLIDPANRPIIDSLDYTPLGGAAPSHLWFGKWLPGQSMRDPYRMQLDTVPAGDYFIEVGLYEQVSKRRLYIYDQGNIVGDRLILGPVTVDP